MSGVRNQNSSQQQREEDTVEIMMWAKLAKPEGIGNREFFDVWYQESIAALQALKAGAIKNIWKVAGKYEVVAVMEVASGDDLDAIVHSLPIWKLGYAHIVPEINWIPLRSYENWSTQLDGMRKA
ncbi:MAG: MIase like protein [Gammaproteobacteria bacterium]|nr:MIase like protein [Gammaproteobacteria bacterium]